MIPVRRSSIFRLGQRSWGQISQLKAAWHSLSYSTEACTGSATHSAQPNPASRSGNVFDTEKVLDFDPYNYTGARWLVNDNLQRRLRYINFDFNELSEKVLALSDAKSITNCEKIEGSNHRVFTFTLDNGNRTIARLPFKVAGPPSLTTASEVATIRYRQSTPEHKSHYRGTNIVQFNKKQRSQSPKSSTGATMPPTTSGASTSSQSTHLVQTSTGNGPI